VTWDFIQKVYFRWVRKAKEQLHASLSEVKSWNQLKLFILRISFRWTLLLQEIIDWTLFLWECTRLKLTWDENLSSLVARDSQELSKNFSFFLIDKRSVTLPSTPNARWDFAEHQIPFLIFHFHAPCTKTFSF
jgi:hypothetical protein